MASQSAWLNQWGRAAVRDIWPINGPWPVSYPVNATGTGVPVYIPDTPLALGVLGPRASMIHNPWAGQTITDDHGTCVASLVGSDTHGIATGCLMLGAACKDGAGNGTVANLEAALDAILAHKQANYPNQKAVCVMATQVAGQGVANGLASRVAALKSAGVYVLAATGQASSGGAGIDDLLTSGFNIWPAEDHNATPVTGCSYSGGRHPLYHCINRSDQVIAPSLDHEYLNHLGQPVSGWGTTLAVANAAGVLACYIGAGLADPLQALLDARVFGRAHDFPADTGVLYMDPAMQDASPPPPPPPPGEGRIVAPMSGTSVIVPIPDGWAGYEINTRGVTVSQASSNLVVSLRSGGARVQASGVTVVNGGNAVSFTGTGIATNGGATGLTRWVHGRVTSPRDPAKKTMFRVHSTLAPQDAYRSGTAVAASDDNEIEFWIAGGGSMTGGEIEIERL